MTTQTFSQPPMRLLGIVPAASIVTLLILYLMYQLINTDFAELEEPDEPTNITAFLNPDSTVIENKYAHLDKPAKPQPPEVQPSPPQVEPVDPGVTSTSTGLFPPTKPTIDIALPISSGDQAMPFIKVQPNYPTSASSRGIQGYVDVMFDVAPTGATENIRIVNAVPSSIFNSSVVQAIKRWKYKPKMVNEVPVKTLDVRERIIFELAKE